MEEFLSLLLFLSEEDLREITSFEPTARFLSQEALLKKSALNLSSKESAESRITAE